MKVIAKSCAKKVAKSITQGALVNQNEPEVDIYIEGLTTPLSSDQIGKLNTFVKSLKTGLGISALSDAFDVMYILAGETAESSLRNFVKNAHHATAVNSPTFTATEGFTGNGSSSYLSNNYIPSINAVRISLNSSAYGFYIRSGIVANTNHVIFGGREYVNINSTLLQIRIDSNRIVAAINQGVSAVSNSGVSTDTAGLYTFIREGASSLKVYRNAVEKATFTNASTGLTTVNMPILAFNSAGSITGFCPYQLSIYYAGKSFTQPELAIIQSAIESYMDSNGKGIIS
jgi:hypothetical protein